MNSDALILLCNIIGKVMFASTPLTTQVKEQEEKREMGHYRDDREGKLVVVC